MDKFKNKYKIESVRLQNYDYSQKGMYFVTICTKDREHFFGEIENAKMELNEIGKIAEQCWQEIPKHFPHVNLDIHHVMPNHIHGIIEIIQDETNEFCRGVAQDHCRGVALPRLEGVPNDAEGFLQMPVGIPRDEAVPRLYAGKYPKMSEISPKPGSLSVIIGSFKSIVSKAANKKFSNVGFAWQSRFWDHIVRDENELNRIREYIQTNPVMWERDRNNEENLWM